MKRCIIIFVTILFAITVDARINDNKIFEKFYRFTSQEFSTQLNEYIRHNQIDSAMLCASVQASKYGKMNLKNDEVQACCLAFRYMGLEFLRSYYNYQKAAENLLKAEHIATQNEFVVLQTQIVADKAILTATQNDLENDYIYSDSVINDFKRACHCMMELIKSDNSNYRKLHVELNIPNLFYLALKFDKTREVVQEVKAFKVLQNKITPICNIADVFCKAIEVYETHNYDGTIEVLQTPLKRSPLLNDRDFIQLQSMLKVAQYAVLLKCNKRAEALKLLLGQEMFLRDNQMIFELLEILQLIKQHYEVDGNLVMAKEYKLRYYTTKDEFINKSRLGKMDEARLNIELEQMRENVREMNYRQRVQSFYIWGLCIIAVLSVTILLILFYNFRKTKKVNRLLYEKNVALLKSDSELQPNNLIVINNTQQVVGDYLELLNKINAIMETSPEVYTEGFTLNRLAELVESNSKYVSRAINSCNQCNFNSFLNEYRIREACRRLLDSENYGSYTIETIAHSVGYKSRSNFATIFKQITGMSPSAFLKMSKEK